MSGLEFPIGDKNRGYGLVQTGAEWETSVWSDGICCRTDRWDSQQEALAYILFRAETCGDWTVRELRRAAEALGRKLVGRVNQYGTPLPGHRFA